MHSMISTSTCDIIAKFNIHSFMEKCTYFILAKFLHFCNKINVRFGVNFGKVLVNNLKCAIAKLKSPTFES